MSADAKMSNPRINPVLDTFFRSCIFTLCLFPSDSNSYRLPDRKIRPAAACPSQKTCPNRQKFSNWTNFIGRHRKLNKFLFFLLIIYTFRIFPRSTREFDTSFSIVKTRHIEITPLTVNFLSNFMILLVLVGACCDII